MSEPTPRLVVLSGPSGVGKSTVVNCVCGLEPRIWLSISTTTRAPRPGELDGREYHFVRDAQFDQLVSTGAFLEWAEFAGNRYGTTSEPVEAHLAAGYSVLLEIELQGARTIRLVEPDALLVFLAPPNWDELVRRLVGRGTEAPEVVERRLGVARVELAAEAEFDVTIVNSSVEAAASALLDLLGYPH
ncbi:MAG: guanylate kinase [Actinomycetes bacterium]